MQRWENIEEWLVATATADLQETDEVRPCLLAFCGPRPLFAAFVRPFPKGGYEDPLTELLALAAPLDADRLALSIAGRAWSLEDPVPPVTADGDLRQRVLVIDQVDGYGKRPRGTSALFPFTREGRHVEWGEPTRLQDGQGWILAALRVTVRGRHHLRGSLSQVRAQALRCMALGHEVTVDPAVADRLGLSCSI